LPSQLTQLPYQPYRSNVTMMSYLLRKEGLKLNLNLSALISWRSAYIQLDRSIRISSTSRTFKGSDQEDERSHGRHSASCKHFIRRRIHSEWSLFPSGTWTSRSRLPYCNDSGHWRLDKKETRKRETARTKYRREDPRFIVLASCTHTQMTALISSLLTLGGASPIFALF
jgi:hypothetical protein